MEKERIAWVDLLKIIACFLVVFSHNCDPYVAVFDSDRSTFLAGVFSGSLTRSSVPLFVMMTGVLLLPTTRTMSQFYRRRIGRILPPLIFWSAALPLFYYLYINRIPLSTNPAINPADYTLFETLRRAVTFIFNFNYTTTPLWYLYMLIGLYLIIPLLNAWLVQATRKELRLFLSVWFITLFIPYIKMFAPVLGYAGNYGNMGIFGICDWNEYGTFYYISGFIGYLVLAYYLVTYPLKISLAKTLLYGIPLFLIGYAITSFGFIEVQRYYPGNYAYLEIIWFFTGINVFMMTLPIFVIIQKLPVHPNKWLARAASLTFGIYLCHFFFVQVGYDMLTPLTLPVPVKIILGAIFAFSVSAILVAVMKQWRPTRLFVE
ncbi:MAG: acyltransferase [Bacteroidetes bacterium]|uniref:Acyltransferase n=1 Tax=Candidatus Caccoplasma merdipullorum TaxID=2840718 RepID=A0A9D9E627_9BACT|nr:acyltransferase [Candidatus Caccoplasma merdipullorum]